MKTNQPTHIAPKKFARQLSRSANNAANQTTNQQIRHPPEPVNKAAKQTTGQCA